MHDLKAVLVGLVLIMARHAIESRRGQEREHRDNQDEQRKRSPVAHVTYAPSRPVVRHHPVRQPITQIEQDQELQQDNRQFLGDVAEHLVPHLVSEDKQRLRCGHVLHRGVPYHDPFGSSEASDVSVQLSGLLAGLHLEHALRRDVHSAAVDDPLDLRDQVGMMAGQRLELIEQWINPNRLDEDYKDDDRDDRQPEVEPPAARAAPQHGIEYPSQNAGEETPEQQGLSPVSEPGTQLLNRKPILQADVVLVTVEWKLGQFEYKHEHRHNNGGLHHSESRYGGCQVT